MPSTETITLRLVAQDLASGNISKAIGKIDKMAQRGGIAGSVMQGVGIQFGMMLNPMMLAARGIGTVTDYMGDAVRAASDLEESQSKVGEVFDETADDVRDWADELDSAYGISKQAALEAAGTFGNFIQALGGGEAEASRMSKALVELAGDLGSFNNVARDEVLVALRSGLAGETEPMRRLGVDISAARIKALALAEGIGGLNGKLTESQKVTLRYKAILEDTDKAQGDAIRTVDSLAGSERELAAESEDLAAAIGKKLLPYTQTWNQLLLGALDSVEKIMAFGSNPAMAAAMLEQQARMAHEGLAAELGLTYDELSQRIIDAAGRPLPTFKLLMEAYEEVGRAAIELTDRQVAEMARFSDHNRAAAASFGSIDVAAASTDAELRAIIATLKDFNKQLDDFSDVKNIDNVNAAIRRTREAMERAAEKGDSAAWARRKARLEELRDERDRSKEADKAMQSWEKRRKVESEAEDEASAARKAQNREIRMVAKNHEATTKDVRRMLNEQGGDMDAVRAKLKGQKDDAEETAEGMSALAEESKHAADEARLADKELAKVIGSAQKLDAIDPHLTITADITDAEEKVLQLKALLSTLDDGDPYSQWGLRGSSGWGWGRTPEGSASAGGFIPPNATYLVGEKGPELLTVGGRGGHITPNHAIGGPTINISGYFLGTPDEVAEELGPAISRWLRN